MDDIKKNVKKENYDDLENYNKNTIKKITSIGNKECVKLIKEHLWN